MVGFSWCLLQAGGVQKTRRGRTSSGGDVRIGLPTVELGVGIGLSGCGNKELINTHVYTLIATHRS